jgi:hypothetical protein
MSLLKVSAGVVVAGALLLGGCERQSEIVGPGSVEPAAPLLGKGGPNPRPVIWADGEVFASVVTPTSFKPTSGNFDQLYAGGNGFEDGIPLISEAKPGDQDYNGGRWHVNVLRSGVDPDKYADADRVEDLDLNDFEPTGSYFECPMLPRRGNR